MALTGVLLRRSADETAADYITDINTPWDTEVYDTDGFHEGVTNPSRITIPAGANGLYGIFTSTIEGDGSTSDSRTLLRKNGNITTAFGVGFAGHYAHSNGSGGTGHGGTIDIWNHFVSPPNLLATGDYYEATWHAATGTAGILKASGSSFGLRVLNSWQTQRVLAEMSANMTAADLSTPTALAWDAADVYDTDGVHDPTTNNTKLIIPSALNGKYAVVRASTWVDPATVTATSGLSLAIRKGGSISYDGFGGVSARNGYGLTCQTQAIAVATGDEFEALLFSSDTSVDVIAARSSFGLMVVG